MQAGDRSIGWCVRLGPAAAIPATARPDAGRVVADARVRGQSQATTADSPPRLLRVANSEEQRALAQTQRLCPERRCRRRGLKDVKTCCPQRLRPSCRYTHWLWQEPLQFHALALGRRLPRSGANPDQDEP